MFDAAQKNSESEEVDLSDSENEDAKVSGPEVKISEPETKEHLQQCGNCIIS